MMDGLIDVLAWLALMGGVSFTLIGVIGLLRLPDFYTRLHAAGVADTLGPALILLGLILQAGWTLTSVKLLLMLLFVWFTSIVATHALARAALSDPRNPRPILGQETPPSKSS
ncbi:MAG: monovalent cation/H(+) antiporter subunit G [Candidatus Contendobacter sp.]|nr:monovalent cation/H(+) antiporter subunit G [Candidatus Contendobacter sp.]MDS4060182.1 monovalent cation/H(+) antiporter subunit G [Candidatus Contendobacter sp.]